MKIPVFRAQLKRAVSAPGVRIAKYLQNGSISKDGVVGRAVDGGFIAMGDLWVDPDRGQLMISRGTGTRVLGMPLEDCAWVEYDEGLTPAAEPEPEPEPENGGTRRRRRSAMQEGLDTDHPL